MSFFNAVDIGVVAMVLGALLAAATLVFVMPAAFCASTLATSNRAYWQVFMIVAVCGVASLALLLTPSSDVTNTIDNPSNMSTSSQKFDKTLERLRFESGSLRLSGDTYTVKEILSDGGVKSAVLDGADDVVFYPVEDKVDCRAELAQHSETLTKTQQNESWWWPSRNSDEPTVEEKVLNTSWHVYLTSAEIDKLG